MLLSLLGPPNCGKSAMAEALCLHVCKELRRRPTYLTTLPESEAHRYRIARHRRRRGPRWNVCALDMSGPAVIEVLKRLNRRGGCVLLDGIAPIFVKQIVVYNRLDTELEAFATQILQVLATDSRCIWIVVDTPTLGAYDPSGLGSLLDRFHMNLFKIGPAIEFVER